MGVKEVLPKKNFGTQKLRPRKKLGPKSLVKIGSVRTEIFLIWTNVARTNVAWTNVAWTNVTVTVVICSIWSQESL